MKIINKLILLLSISICQNTDSLFQLGNDYYLDEKYDQAINIFEKISKDYEHEDLYLNLGNSYYRVGMLGNAIWSYERGHLLSPRDNDINYNLNYVRNQIRDRIIPPEDFFLIAVYRAIIEKLTLLDLIAMSGLILLSLGTLYVSKNFGILSNKISGIMKTILLILIFSNGFIILDKYWSVSDRENGVVISIESDVRSSPINRGENIVFIIHEGTKVEIVTKQPGWYEIVLLDGKKGWISVDGVRII